jgi:hypothetical protein
MKAFSSEVGTGSREENATKQKLNPDWYQSRRGSNATDWGGRVEVPQMSKALRRDRDHAPSGSKLCTTLSTQPQIALAESCI